MAGLLLSGPAGAGKSEEARRVMAESNIPAVVIDFQAIYAALLLLDRDADGRYPERQGRDSHLLPLAEYTRRAATTGAVDRQLFAIVTNSDGDADRRRTLLGLLGAGGQERIIDPGRESCHPKAIDGGPAFDSMHPSDSTMVRKALMDTLTCEIRLAEDESRQSPGRLVGTLLTYEVRAKDRKELFKRGAIRFPDAGILINDMHNRQSPLLRAMPYLDGDALKVDQPFPDTLRARDAVTNLREGILTGLSIEFYAERETLRNGIREIASAYVPRAGLVDVPSYADSLVEVRNAAGANRIILAARLSL